MKMTSAPVTYVCFCVCKHISHITVAAVEENRQSKRLGWTILACLIHMDFFRESEGRGSMCLCVLSRTQGEIRRNPTFQLSISLFTAHFSSPTSLFFIPFALSLLTSCFGAAMMWRCHRLFHAAPFNKEFCVDDANCFFPPSECGCFCGCVQCVWVSTAAKAGLRMFIYCDVLACPLALSRLSSPGIILTRGRPKYD